jgi:hypothetical protein
MPPRVKGLYNPPAQQSVKRYAGHSEELQYDASDIGLQCVQKTPRSGSDAVIALVDQIPACCHHARPFSHAQQGLISDAANARLARSLAEPAYNSCIL